jgi:hypothetical protein
MTKVGRNESCPCGSGRKYKRCCGAIGNSGAAQTGPSAEGLQRLNLEMIRQDAKEHRRRLMQGLGRPIISFESNGFRLVAVGNEIRWSKRWVTFADFLFDFIKAKLTPEWGNGELAKPEAERHPLLGWYRRVCEWQRAHSATMQGGVYSASMTGVVRAYLGLAYDLYLAAHNAELPALLLKRLRNARTFEGAFYEAFVIGSFAKAGFAIEFEDEEDSTTTHCEFTATHQITGRKFSVEAKAVASSPGRSGASVRPAKVRDPLYKALRKTAPHPRIVFIELNRAQTILASGEPDWVSQIDQDLAQAEAELTIDGQPAPPAYVFITNRAFMQALDDLDCGEVGIGHGFKIMEFPQGRGCKSFLEAVDARERHQEPHWLLKAMETRTVIPSTFDDRLPEEVFSSEQVAPLLIGETYLVPDGNGCEVPGVLYDGSVLESECKAYGVYQLADGRSIVCTTPLSDAELAQYRRSPDTFFGVIKEVSRGIKHPLDCYDFLHSAHAKMSREKLLEFMVGWPDFDMLKSLSQPELVKRYCARMAEGMWAQIAAKNTPPPTATAARSTAA